MRKFRKFRGTWLPSYGTSLVEEGHPTYDTAGLSDVISVSNGDVVNTKIIALIPDQQATDYDESGDGSLNTLVDFVGTEYSLRRLVGKFHAYYSTTTGSPDQLAVKLGLGFFIAREDPELFGLPLGVDNDTFNATANTRSLQSFESFSPLSLATTRQPWIWRRTWHLFQPITGQQPSNAGFPVSTMGYGSVLDGPHIDAKTRRRVKQEERLYAAVSMQYQQAVNVTTPTGSVDVQFDLDLRYFGALRKARGKSAF